MKQRRRIVLITTLIIALVLSGTLTVFGAKITTTSAPTIKVMYDGNYIAFKDAAPKIIDGRTMVPFRQILEDMGTVVSFDNLTKTVLAKKGITEFSFVIGGSDISIKENSVKSVKKMDVVPFLDKNTNRTYVSARFMAESLGYGVGWDGTAKVVVISDYEKLFANADTDFSILNKLIATEIDPSKTYRTAGSFRTAVSTPAPSTDPTAKPMEYGMTGSIDAVQHKTDADIVMQLTVDAEKAIAAMPADQQAMARATFDTLKNMTIKMKMKMNGTDGLMYMNANMFSMLDSTIDQNTWMKMDIFKTYKDMGIDMKNILALSTEKVSIGKLLTQYGLAAQTADANTYASVKACYTLFKNLIGDQAFVQSKSGTTATYTLNITPASVAAAIAKTGLTEGSTMSLSDIAEAINLIKQADFSGSLVFKTEKDKMTSYVMTGEYDASGTIGSFDISGTPMNTNITMNFSMKGLMEMAMTMTSSIRETTEKVDLNLPQGAKIVDYNTLIPPVKPL